MMLHLAAAAPCMHGIRRNFNIMSTISSRAQALALPPEVISLVFEHLDNVLPYTERHAEDDANLFYNNHGDFIHATPSLKNASLVSRQWREAAWPLLFRHIYIRYFDWDPQDDHLDACEPVKDAVDFLNSNHASLRHIVQSISLFIQPSERVLEQPKQMREGAAQMAVMWRNILWGLEEVYKSMNPQHDPYRLLLDAIFPLSRVQRMTIIAPSTVAQDFLCKSRFCYPPIADKRYVLHIMTLTTGPKMPSKPEPATAPLATSAVPLHRLLYRGIGECLIMNAGWDLTSPPSSQNGWAMMNDRTITFMLMTCRCGRVTNDTDIGQDNFCNNNFCNNNFSMVSYSTSVIWECFHNAKLMWIQVPP
jgi:hypothetical protein